MSSLMDYDIALQLLISFVIGTAIGLEREYRSKAAGLRTMIMICLGSTIFTEISIHLEGGAPDRIASTIVTGIGFLGAGVIFKDGLTISGITTATTIWISAALGMAVGAGQYFLAIAGSGIVLVVLIIFEKFQMVIERFHQSRSYRIFFMGSDAFLKSMEEKITELKLDFHKKKDLKEVDSSLVVYEVFGKEKRLDQFNDYLKNDSQVKSYDY